MAKAHTVDLLIRDIGDAGFPAVDEQVALARTIRDPAGSRKEREAAIGEMMRRNLPFLISVARGLLRRGDDLGDLVAWGVPGLRRACEKFDPDRGVRFGTYAGPWIRQAIHRGRLESAEGRPYRIPYFLHDRHRRAGKLRAELAGRGEAVDLAEAGRRLGYASDAPFLGRADAAIAHDDGEEPGPADLPADVPAHDQLERAEEAERLGRLMTRLAERDRAVLRLWYGFDRIPGLEDAAIRTADRPSALIAAHLGLSRERVRQIHRDALARLRGWANGEGAYPASR